MREFRFRYFIPRRALGWLTADTEPKPVLDAEYVEIKVFHYDYFKARSLADIHWQGWLYKNGYKDRDTDHSGYYPKDKA